MPKKQQASSSGYIGPVFQIRDLTGGVNLRPSPTNIKPEQATLLVNTLISNVGELGVYPGWKTFSTSSLGARRAQGAKRIYLTGSTFTLGADNGNVYKPDDSGVWGSAVLTGLHATNAIDFPHDRDLVAAFDGSTVPKKTTNGTTWTQLGITAPAALGLAAVAGGSLVSGDVYEVTATYLNSALNQESNESPVSTVTPSGANLTIQVTTVLSADGQVDKIRLYARDKTSGEASRRLVTTITNASGTTNIASNTWTTATVAPPIGQNSVALPMAFGVVWKNRWWGRDATTTNRLRFTQIFQSMGWADTFFVDIPFERGEGIQAMIPLGDVLVIFGTTKFYLIIGQTSLDFEVRPALGSQTGAFGPRCVDVLENSIVHAGGPGTYLYNGASDSLLTYPIDPAWQYMVGNTTIAELSVLPIAYHKLRKELRIAVPVLYPLGTRGEWILDLNRTNAPQQQAQSTQLQAWFATDRTVGGYMQWDGNEPISNNQGRIFSWSPTVVKLYEERTTTSADGQDITMQYQGFMLPFGIQKARIIDTYLEYQPSAATSFSVDLKVDGVLQGAQSFSLGAGLTQYGTDKYGTATYGGGANRKELPIMWPLTAEGYSAQLILKYIGQGAPKFYTYGHNAMEEDLPRGL